MEISLGIPSKLTLEVLFEPAIPLQISSQKFQKKHITVMYVFVYLYHAQFVTAQC